MKNINKEVIINSVSKSIYEDALFEFDVVKTKNLVVNEDDDSVKIKLDIQDNNIYRKVVINYKYEKNSFTGFCDCNDCKKSGTCFHLAIAALTYNEYVKKQTSSLKQRESDKYKIDLLKQVYDFKSDKDLIFFNVHISSVKDNKVKLHLRAGLVGSHDYKVNDVYKFLNLINDSKKISIGKEFKSDNYELEQTSKQIFDRLYSLVLRLNAIGLKAEKDYFDISEIHDLLAILINQDIYYNTQEYLVKNRLDDITLKVDLISDGIELSLSRADEYIKVDDKIVVNNFNSTIYVLDKRQMSKIDLINSFVADQKKIIISAENKAEFIQEILPKIYSEFNVVLDEKLELDVINEKLKTEFYCYLENKIIHIRPKFLYGEHDAFSKQSSVLIRRNIKVEEQMMNLILNNGYVYDYFKNEFVIQAERRQFLFLTKTIHEIRQEVDVYLDDNLKKAIKNVNSSNVSISINSNNNSDYFELDIDLQDIPLDEVSKVIKSFKQKKDFHRLEDGSFVHLLDDKLLEQLEFVEELSEEKLMNNYHIPKYRAIYIKNNIDGLFDKVNYEDDFNDYINDITNIKEVDFSKLTINNHELRDYQKFGVRFLNSHYQANTGALLADEMGLGKTLQVISFLKYNNINDALIVLPKALLYNWKYEFEKYAPEIEVALIYGSKENRVKELKKHNHKHVILTSYNSLVNDVELYEAKNFKTIIIDEAQYIKNPNSKTAQSVKKVKADYYIALTGTPIENNILELWSIFDFILPGYLSDMKTFKAKYSKKESLQNLKNIISPFILRRLKKDVLKELPDKIENNIICEMEELQKQMYVKYAKEIKEEVNHYLNVKNLGQKHMQILSAITRLRQLAIDPSLFVDEYSNVSGKACVFEELIDEIVSSGQKVIVFSQYTTMLRKLQILLENKNISHYVLDGSTKPIDRLKDIEKFNKNKVPVYLISLKAGGVGLNLTSASNVIIYDPWWNPATENQAIDRTHRIGQKNNVNVYRLISKGSIEEKIMDIKNDKISILNETLDNEEVLLNNLDQETLVNLLSLEEIE